MTEDGVRSRASGLLAGLAAGDRIGGPVRMALELGESLAELGRFEVGDIARRYLAWWRAGGFDTGPTAAEVFAMVSGGASWEQGAATVDERSGGRTAGCNPAHRSVPLALIPHFDDDALAEAAKADARLTHRHPLAGEVAAAVVVLGRGLVQGQVWEAAVERAARGRLPETVVALSQPRRLMSADGYAPHVLAAAVWFVGRSRSLDAALGESLAFAGPANYAPVLVGALAGARWGRAAIPARMLRHVHSGLLHRMEAVARTLASQTAISDG